MDSDPQLGFAFRTVVERVKNGELTAEDIIAKLSKTKVSSINGRRQGTFTSKNLAHIMAFGTKKRAETNGRHLQSNLSLEKYRGLAEEFKPSAQKQPTCQPMSRLGSDYAEWEDEG